MASINEAYGSLTDTKYEAKVSYIKIDNGKTGISIKQRPYDYSCIKSEENKTFDSILRCNIETDNDLLEFEYKIISSDKEKVIHTGKISGINYFIVDINKTTDYFLIIKPKLNITVNMTTDMFLLNKDDSESKIIEMGEIYKFIKADPVSKKDNSVFYHSLPKPLNIGLKNPSYDIRHTPKINLTSIPDTNMSSFAINHFDGPEMFPDPNPEMFPDLESESDSEQEIHIEIKEPVIKAYNEKITDTGSINGYDRTEMKEEIIGDIEDLKMVIDKEFDAMKKEEMIDKVYKIKNKNKDLFGQAEERKKTEEKDKFNNVLNEIISLRQTEIVHESEKEKEIINETEQEKEIINESEQETEIKNESDTESDSDSDYEKLSKSELIRIVKGKLKSD